jgi:hypothetical protein
MLGLMHRKRMAQWLAIRNKQPRWITAIPVASAATYGVELTASTHCIEGGVKGLQEAMLIQSSTTVLLSTVVTCVR